MSSTPIYVIEVMKLNSRNLLFVFVCKYYIAVDPDSERWELGLGILS